MECSFAPVDITAEEKLMEKLMTILEKLTDCHYSATFFFFLNHFPFLFAIATNLFCHNFKPCEHYLQNESILISYSSLWRSEREKMPHQY